MATETLAPPPAGAPPAPTTPAAPIEQAERDDARDRDRLIEALLALLGVLTVAAWVPLVRWYSLRANANNTHFAFEKLPGQFDSPILRRTALLFAALWLAYLAGFLLLRRARRIGGGTILAVALLVLGPAAANILIYPVGALDVFNYLIELKLTYHYHQNPYLVTFVAYRRDPFALPAFLVDVPLFYGPVWLILAGLPGLIVGYDHVIRLLVAVKLLNLALLLLTGWAIDRYQADRRRGWLAAYLFLANPLVLFEALANGHNDALMACFLLAALLALRARSALAPPLLALSALVKLFTAALAPLLLLTALAQRWPPRRWLPAALLTAGVTVATVAPFWADGQMIDGLQRGTKLSQQMDHVSILSLTEQWVRLKRAEAQHLVWFAPPPQRALPPLSDAERARFQRNFGIAFALLALLVAGATLRGYPVEAAAVVTLLLFLLLLTNLYPWYLIPVVGLLALRRRLLGDTYLFVATLLGLLYYPMYVYAHFATNWLPFYAHLFLALFLTAPMLAYLVAEACWPVVRAVVSRQPVFSLTPDPPRDRGRGEPRRATSSPPLPGSGEGVGG